MYACVYMYYGCLYVCAYRNMHVYASMCAFVCVLYMYIYVCEHEFVNVNV